MSLKKIHTDPVILMEAVKSLAWSSAGLDPSETPEDLFRAVDLLRNAPPLEAWNRGLLMGLRSACPEVVLHTVQACAKRLTSFTSAKHRDDFMERIFEACFINLSGRKNMAREDQLENQRAAQLESASMMLIRAVTDRLRAKPYVHEHQCSRLLSWAKRLENLEGFGELAQSVVEFQRFLGSDERRGSDAREAQRINQFRKYHAFQSPGTTEATLIAYLEEDSKVAVCDLSQEVFSVYRTAFNVQAADRVSRPVRMMFENLIGWLDQIPWRGGTCHEELIEDMAKRASIGVPRSQLNLLTVRHLEAQHELLPGPNHPEDLLVLLRKKFGAPQHQEILIRGLNLLARLPLIRFRIDELWDFLSEENRIYRSQETWEAFLNLIESALTGLPDIVIARGPLSEKEQRREKLMGRLLAADKRMRKQLHDLATGRDALVLSQNAELEKGVRIIAWKTLLRFLPDDRERLYKQGLVDYADQLFKVTIEEATHHAQRPVWTILRIHWERIVGSAAPVAERKARIRAIAGLFETVREYEAVQNDGKSLGPLLAMALDDPDSENCAIAADAIVSAGFRSEIDREKLRRDLLRLRDELTESESSAIGLERRIRDLSRQRSDKQTARAEIGLQQQDLLRQRDHLVIEGWITISRYQVDMREVREQLAQVVIEEQEEAENLRSLQAEMGKRLGQSQKVGSEVLRLVEHQRQSEAEQENAAERQSTMESRLLRTSERYNESENDLNRLRNDPPEEPSPMEDEVEDHAVRERYERARSEHDRRVSALEGRLYELEKRMERERAEIENCGARIKEAARIIARLQRAIQELQQRIDSIRQGIESVRQVLTVAQGRWEALRAQIRELEARVVRLERAFSRKHSATEASLGENSEKFRKTQASLVALGADLQKLAKQIGSASHKQDQQMTRCQELAQCIDSGRQNYDTVGNRARQESAQADAKGQSTQRQTEQSIIEQQETKIQYQYATQRALDGLPPPKTHVERTQQQKRALRERRTKI